MRENYLLENCGARRAAFNPYFLRYIENVWKPDKSQGAAQHLGWTERTLRNYISAKLKFLYGDYWISALRIALNPNNSIKNTEIVKMEKFMESLRRFAEANHYDDAFM